MKRPEQTSQSLKKKFLKVSDRLKDGESVRSWTLGILPALQEALLGWYQISKRDLPWRRQTHPYAITVSEYMLQQTQVVTVIPYYERWMDRFPDWHALASAPAESVLKAWEGLGYYTRARNLQALARKVMARGGEMPRDPLALLALPGIGPYTAAAIGSIAFRLPLAVVDGNVIRVLTRLLAWPEDVGKQSIRKRLQELATDWLLARPGHPVDPGTHNQAVMELGAVVCLPRAPLCLVCPLRIWCRGKTNPEDFPVKKKIAAVTRSENIAVLTRSRSPSAAASEPSCDRGGGQLEIYLEQVPPGKPWAGLWRFPDFDPARMEWGETKAIAKIRYGITKYRVILEAGNARWKSPARVGHGEVLEEAEGRYLSVTELHEKPLAGPHRKLADILTKGGKE